MLPIGLSVLQLITIGYC